MSIQREQEILSKLQQIEVLVVEVVKLMKEELGALAAPTGPAVQQQLAKQPKFPNVHWVRDKNGIETSYIEDPNTSLYQTRNVAISKKPDDKFLTVTWQSQQGDRFFNFRGSCWDSKLADVIAASLAAKTPMEFFIRRSNNWTNIVGVTTPAAVEK